LRHRLGEGKLANLPFTVEGKAREYFVMAEREPGMVDALGPHQTEPEVAEMVVVGSRNRKLKMRHASVSDAYVRR